MKDNCIYRIRLRGPLHEQDRCVLGPVELKIVRRGQVVTLITPGTDQAGLIGLLRYLHGLGLVILSVVRKP